LAVFFGLLPHFNISLLYILRGTAYTTSRFTHGEKLFLFNGDFYVLVFPGSKLETGL
jgi:hypothetical protein